jgi:hypothetical protein
MFLMRARFHCLVPGYYGTALTKKPGRYSGSGFSLPTSIGLVNDTKEIVADASDNDHGRDGPKQQDWHMRLLLICPQ